MSSADAEDVVGDAIVDYLQVAQSSLTTDGLFLLIARRRAFDFFKRRKHEIGLPAANRSSVGPDREHLEKELLARAIHLYASAGKNLDERRLLAIAARVGDGSSFAEACRESEIPRGSQSRYRKTFRSFLSQLNRHL